uniref:Anthranilate--CoA ligase (EC) n=1 Tax=Ganoderma boninense TaxID=34458 RepID=A0A5K1JTN7_9APHY|nr:Anthranilate--CoA ligase (EC [Ganoderma boninense]
MEGEPHFATGDHHPRELAFLYPRKPDPYDAADPSERSFFMLRPGSDVPPKYPEKTPTPTPYDLVVGFLAKRGQSGLLSTVALISREWCRAVRKLRFRSLHVEPNCNFPRLLEVFRPDTVLPFLRQLHVNGRLTSGPPLARDPEHRWLAALVPLFAHILAVSPVDYLFLQSLSWGNVPVEVRAVLVGLPGVRALGIHDVDFWNSNQFLRLLNAHAPRLQFLQVWHATYWAYNHTPSQLQRTEPLLLTELVLGCAYTPLIMEWLLGNREVLAIEELTVASRDVYRDDTRLAKVVKKIAPWLKRFSYNEWGALNGMCEGTNGGDDAESESDEEMEVDDDDDEYKDSEMDEDETSDPDEDPNELIGDDEDQAVGIVTDPTETGQPRMVEVSNNLLLPDDEEHNRMEDGNTEFRNPPFTRKGSDLGHATFEQEIQEFNNPDSPMEMPMVEAIDGRIYWKSTFNFLTLAMLCWPVYSGAEFYRFDLSINFESVDVFNNAPWREIDHTLREVTIPEPDDDDEANEDAEINFRVEIAVKGWELGGRQGKERLKEVKRKLPRTVRKKALHISVNTWSRRPPRPGPREWMMTYM